MSALSPIASIFGLPPDVSPAQAPALARLFITPPPFETGRTQPVAAAPTDPAIALFFAPELAAAEAQAGPSPLDAFEEPRETPPADFGQTDPAIAERFGPELAAAEAQTGPNPLDELPLEERPARAEFADRFLTLVRDRVEDERFVNVVDRFRDAIRERRAVAPESPAERLARLEARPSDLRDILLAGPVEPTVPVAVPAEGAVPPAATPQRGVNAVDFSLRQAQSGRAFHPQSGPVPLANFAVTRPTFFPEIPTTRARPPITSVTRETTTAAEQRFPRIRPVEEARQPSPGEFAKILARFIEFADTRKIGQAVNELVF